MTQPITRAYRKEMIRIATKFKDEFTKAYYINLLNQL